jgi:HlyD family secretion protein
MDVCQLTKRASMALAALIALLMTGCDQSSVSTQQALGLKVSVLKLTPKAQSQEVVLSGQIVAREQVRITTQIDGLRIVRVLADQGQQVAKDAVLVELDSAMIDAEWSQAEQQRLSAQAQLQQARAQEAQAESAWQLAKSDAERFASVEEIGAVSAQELETRRNVAQQAQDGLGVAQANVAAAVAQLANSQAALGLAAKRRQRLKIRAPIAGTLSERHAEVGSIVTTSDPPLFLLMPNGAREFEAELDWSQLARLPANLIARVEIAQFASTFDATLRTRAQSVRASDRRGPVRFALTGADQVPIGASAQAHFKLAESSALSLPPSAVLFDPQAWVYVVDPQLRVQRRTVQLSADASGDQLALISGLIEGDLVVENASALLSPGALIRPVLNSANATSAAETDASKTGASPAIEQSR